MAVISTIRMLELLACPLTKGPFALRPRTGPNLVSRLAKLAYPVRDGIPIMLPSEARELDEKEVARQDAPPGGSQAGLKSSISRPRG